jgi:hypothetical protein
VAGARGYPRAVSRSLTRALGLLAELAVVVGSLWVRWMSWRRGQPDPPVPALDHVTDAQWALGAPWDFVLDGPDAAQWARNARALAEGGVLDPHRLPVHGLGTLLVQSQVGDPLHAGHLLNHLCGALLLPVIYVAGRRWVGRGPAALATLVVAAHPLVLRSRDMYGVDPIFALLAFGALGAAWAAHERRIGALVVAGLCLGLALSTHFLAAALVVPAVAAVLLWPRGELGRLGGAGLLLGVAAGVWRLLLLGYPAPSLGGVAALYLEGVSARDASGDQVAGVMTVVAEGAARLPGAAAALWGDGLGGWVVVGAVVVGLVSPWLPWTNRSLRTRLGRLALGLALAPTLLLFAAQAPERYHLYAVPLVALCVGAGVADWVGVAERRLELDARPLSFVALTLLGGWAVHTLRAHWPERMPTDRPLHEQRLGQGIAADVPDAVAVVTGVRPIGFHAGLQVCPAPVWSNDAQPDLAHMASGCPTGRLAYVRLVETDRAGQGDAGSPALDAWVARCPAAFSVRTERRLAVVHRLDNAGGQITCGE